MTGFSDRFTGINRVFGASAEKHFFNKHVCVIGIGGVGSWAVEALVRSGIGKITMIDQDDISSSNVNRQIHSLSSTIGLPKIQVMRDRIHEINPKCEVTAVEDFLLEESLEPHLLNEYDYVIDAIDGIRIKAAMIHFCRRNKIKIITTGGAGGLLDPCAITISDLSKTWNDPLAAKVRARLRYAHHFTKNEKRSFGVECVFSTEQPRYPKPDGTITFQKSDPSRQKQTNVTLDCNSGLGSFSGVTATFGFVAASRVLNKLILK